MFKFLFGSKKESTPTPAISFCPKCGCSFTEMGYAPVYQYHIDRIACGNKSNSVCEEEHLHLCCPRCGYDWIHPVLMKN